MKFLFDTDAEICAKGGNLNLDKCVLVAEVYGRTVIPDPDSLVSCYFVMHQMDEEEAESAMAFFAEQPSLIVDSKALADHSGAELPALVAIRWSDDTARFYNSVTYYNIYKDIPNNSVIRKDGFDLFQAIQAVSRGEDLPSCDPLPDYDYRALRRMVYALRCGVMDDKDPWFKKELDGLKEVTDGNPEGSETLLARAEDMEAAMRGEVEIGEGFSVVIPTQIERPKSAGAIIDWVSQGGREVVVGFNLSALQAAHLFKAVHENPDQFVSKEHLLSNDGRETLGKPFVCRDSNIKWMVTDITGRRNAKAYAEVQKKMSGEAN